MTAQAKVEGLRRLGSTREGLLVAQLLEVQIYLEGHHDADCRDRKGGTCNCDVNDLWWDIEELVNPLEDHP